MNNRRFVSGSSLILVGWLAVTFIYKVPAKSYPKHDKKLVTATLKVKSKKITAAIAP